MNSVEPLSLAQNRLGEGPIWSSEEQALYWVDIRAGSYSRFDPLSGSCETTVVGVPIGVMAQRASGGLVMATKQGFAFWDTQSQTLEVFAHPEASKPHMRFNDGAVDARGRFWAGTMSEASDPQPEGSLYRLDPDRSVHRILTRMGIPNGLGWSPDQNIMYITDTARGTISAYDFDLEAGTISNGRVLIATAPGALALPDGLAVDREGFLWSAYWDGAQLMRHAPNGKLERVINVPALRPTSCVFGGKNLDELYITSSRDELNEEELAQYPHSGDVFRLKTGILGSEQFQFAG